MRTAKPHYQTAHAAYQALSQLETCLKECGLEPSLLELVKIRASQLNGCAFCLDMHTTDALKGGESVRRLTTLPLWRESPFFSPRERAALAWTEALTSLHLHQATDALYQETLQAFPEQELVNLTYAIAAINAWNRLGIAFQVDLPSL